MSRKLMAEMKSDIGVQSTGRMTTWQDKRRFNPRAFSRRVETPAFKFKTLENRVVQYYQRCVGTHRLISTSLFQMLCDFYVP